MNFSYSELCSIIYLGLVYIFPRGLKQIKNERVFSTIREINEILSLTNEPDKLVNMALDTLSQALEIECCWIQTIHDRKHKILLLAAERGFSPAIRQEIASMDIGHGFSEQIIGLGHKIIIPDLSNDGLYGLSSFRNTGYKWLVAVPLMTYRVHGILGTASSNRKLLKKDTADLIMVVAGLIAHSLTKAHFSQKLPEIKETGNTPIKEAVEIISEKPPDTPAPPIVEDLKITAGKMESTPVNNTSEDTLPPPENKIEVETNTTAPINPPQSEQPARHDTAFHRHKHKMESFKKTHK